MAKPRREITPTERETLIALWNAGRGHNYICGVFCTGNTVTQRWISELGDDPRLDPAGRAQAIRLCRVRKLCKGDSSGWSAAETTRIIERARQLAPSCYGYAQIAEKMGITVKRLEAALSVARRRGTPVAVRRSRKSAEHLPPPAALPPFIRHTYDGPRYDFTCLNRSHEKNLLTSTGQRA